MSAQRSNAEIPMVVRRFIVRKLSLQATAVKLVYSGGLMVAATRQTHGETECNFHARIAPSLQSIQSLAPFDFKHRVLDSKQKEVPQADLPRCSASMERNQGRMPP